MRFSENSHKAAGMINTVARWFAAGFVAGFVFSDADTRPSDDPVLTPHLS